MKRLVYRTGEHIVVGDHVRVKRWLRADLIGTVSYVYDHAAPVARDVNDYGFSVRLTDVRELWIGSSPDERVVFIGRGKEE